MTTSEGPVTTSAESGPPPLVVRDVTAGYGATDVVLDSVSLQVRRGLVTAVLGPNGSGKSTALRAAFGLVRVREGTIELGGEVVNDLPVHERIRRGMALLPQGHSVFGDLTVEENLLLGGWIFGGDNDRMRSALDRTYEHYPLLAERRQMTAGQLSGGQQRILEIARLVVTDPDVLLIDEPSVGLAPILVDGVYDEIERLKALRKTVLLVDQNVEAAIDLADYVYILEYGKTRAEGAVGEFEGDIGKIVKGWLAV